MTPASLELLRLIATRPIPAPHCNRHLRKSLVKLGYVEPVTSEIVTMKLVTEDEARRGNMKPDFTRIATMYCITVAGKSYLETLMFAEIASGAFTGETHK